MSVPGEWPAGEDGASDARIAGETLAAEVGGDADATQALGPQDVTSGSSCARHRTLGEVLPDLGPAPADASPKARPVAGGPSPEAAASSKSYAQAKLVAVRAWAFVGCAAVFVIVMQALGAVGMAIECVVVGAIVGFICSGITNWLERKGMGRGAGALIALVVVFAVMVGVLVLVVPMLVEQLRQLLERIPSIFSQVQAYVHDLWSTYGNAQTAELQTNVQNVLQALANIGGQMAQDLADSLSEAFVPNVMNLSNGFVMFFLGLVLAYWFAKDYPVIMRELGVIAGPRHADDLSLLVAVLSRSVGGYMRGIVVTSVLNGVLAFAGFAVAGNPFSAVMGTIVCFMHFIPVVGPGVSATVATLVGLVVSPEVAFWTLVWAVVAQNVTDNVVSPLVMQGSVKIHPAMSLIGITVGASLGGAVGMAFAVPLTAAIKGVFVYYFETKTARQLVSYDGAFFKGTPFHHEDGTPVPAYDALDDDSFLAQSRLVEYDELSDAEVTAPPERLAHHGLGDTLRLRLEDLKRKQ